MYRVFNMGIGLVLVVRPYFADSVQRMLSDCGLQNWQLGEVVRGQTDVVWAK
jgi:phosphoribosylformylglycinamidine cyclo-ligase